MARKKSEELRELAKLKYVSSDLSAKDVAAIIGVTEHTIGKWRKEEQWDELRSINKIQPERLIKLALGQIDAIYKQAADDKRAVLNSSEIDAISKHSKTIANLRKEIDPQTIMEVIDGLLGFLSVVNLPLAQQLTPHSLDYVSSKIREKK
jgi:transposase-like protein